MKTTFFLIGLLLAIECYCRFDTIAPVCTIAQIQLKDEGVWMEYTCMIPMDSGFATLQFDQLPQHFNKSKIGFSFPSSIEKGGVEFIKTKPVPLDQYLKKKRFETKIKALETNLVQLIDSLKASTAIEKALILEKYRTVKKMKGVKDLASIDGQFAKRFDQISARKMEQYQAIKRLRFQIKELKDNLSHFLKNAGKDTYQMFVNVYQADSAEINFKWSVIQFYEEDTSIQMTAKNHLPQTTETFVLSGQLIDETGYAPISNAQLSVYRGRLWIEDTQTDERGHFSFTLKESGNYKVVVEDAFFSRNINKFLLNEENNVVHKRILLKYKTKLSAWEMAAYALPLIEVVKTVVQE